MINTTTAPDTAPPTPAIADVDELPDDMDLDELSAARGGPCPPERAVDREIDLEIASIQRPPADS